MGGNAVAQGPTISLNGFLLRRGVDPTLALSDSSREVASHFLWLDGQLQPLGSSASTYDAPDAVVLSLLSRPSSPPAWETLIAEIFSPPGFSPAYSQSLGALVYLKVRDRADDRGRLRWMCWAFGSASRSLRRGALEPRFGLFAALNRIARADEGGLRQLEYRSFGAYRQRTGHTAGRDTPLDGFRIDPLIDLLSGVGGRTGQGSAAQVYGGRPLRLHTRVHGIDDLRALAQAGMDDFRDSSYRRAGFSFVDDFVPVEDDGELDTLRGELARLVLAQSDRVDAFFPDDLVEYEDPRAIHFVLLPGERARNPSRITLTPSNLATAIRDAGAKGLDRTIRFLDASGELVAGATVLECLSADFSFKEARFVVSDGDFYRVREEFVDGIDKSLKVLPSSPLSFPGYKGGEEGPWLLRTAEDLDREFVCVDGELIRLSGESPFEAADLVHVSGTMVHAKRKGRSSALSYAMVQARRSCQILPVVDDARKQLEGFVRERAATDKVASRVIDSLQKLEKSPPGLDVVLLILGRKPARGLLGLPLLAKLELSETARQIGQLGFQLSVAQIGLK
jgi:uncharacterized protein (TIGR04141 family)